MPFTLTSVVWNQWSFYVCILCVLACHVGMEPCTHGVVWTWSPVHMDVAKTHLRSKPRTRIDMTSLRKHDRNEWNEAHAEVERGRQLQGYSKWQHNLLICIASKGHHKNLGVYVVSKMMCNCENGSSVLWLSSWSCDFLILPNNPLQRFLLWSFWS